METIYNKKSLELILEVVPQFPTPHEELEQYTTPSEIAADILWYAYMHGDITDKLIIDLGCGTGKLLLGALMLGAKYGICVDIDSSALQLAREVINKHVSTPFDAVIADLRQAEPPLSTRPTNEGHHRVNASANCTVIMNPPFGVKSKGADFDFIRVAMKLCDTIYSLHKAVPKSIELLGEICKEMGFKLLVINRYRFPIRWFLPKHRERKHIVDVVLVKLKKIL
ncbi:MAG: 50S ribosomal protein L11 methyltransferase [Desulfurococcales archaeon]|nr:50S ribosomal protein L11 methyltransferase [Desulfurococcales archaeon]